MKHLGDISKINGADIEPVDLITFGSPCQDLSVAGKRAGMKHEAHGDGETTRSGLFMEAVRIIKEMREATNGKYPRFALWENVPGAFSSNKGEDFRIVLEEIIQIIEPEAAMPAVPKAGWAYADSYSGHGWSLAYRTFDAQYWGVPQRRRRIYLVADFGSERAKEILFEREGLRGDYASGKPPWQRAATDAESSAGAADSEGAGEIVCMATQQGGAEIRTDDKAPTVTAAAGMSGNNQPVIACSTGFKAGQGVNARGIGWEKEQTPTLASEAGGNSVPSVCYMKQSVFRKGTRPHNVEEAQTWEDAKIANTLNTFDHGESRANELVVEQTSGYSSVSVYESHPIDSRIRELGNVAPTGTVKFAKGTADTPLVCREVLQEYKTYDARGNGDGKTTGTLTGDHERRITDYSSVVCAPTFSLQGNTIDRSAKQNGNGISEDVSHTLNSVDKHGVVYGIGNGQSNQSFMTEQAGALNCMHDQQAIVFDKEVYNSGINGTGGHYIAEGGPAPTLRGTGHAPGVCAQYIVRRLTPIECARLQGFPDAWGKIYSKEFMTPDEYKFWLEVRKTHAKINGKQVRDYTEAQILAWYNKLHTDSAEYKMWGNGIALPTALYCMEGIAEELNAAHRQKRSAPAESLSTSADSTAV